MKKEKVQQASLLDETYQVIYNKNIRVQNDGNLRESHELLKQDSVELSIDREADYVRDYENR